MQVDFLFRNRPGAFSIERVFETVMRAMPGDIACIARKVPKETNHFWDTFPNIVWAHKHLGANVVHITGDVNYCAMGLPGERTVLTIHDLCLIHNYSGWRRFLHRKYWYEKPMKRCKVVTCISQCTRDDLIAQGLPKAQEAIVIHNPVDGGFQPCPKPFNNEVPRILHFNITKNKNLLRTAEALSGIPCHLHIIGRLTEEQAALLKARRIRYSCVENLTNAEMVREYNEADMLCFPSTYEGFGMPVVEAQAVGRPVVTSARAPMTEIAGKGACLVDPEDIADIRRGILAVIRERGYREELVGEGNQNVRQFSARHIAQQYADVYQSL